MSVIIEQGPIKVVSMGGIVLGQSEEMDRKIMDSQRQFYKKYDLNVYELIKEAIESGSL